MRYKQVHQISCGLHEFTERNSTVSCCIHGYFVSAITEGLLVYQTKRYLESTASCQLRPHNPLQSYQPDLIVSTPKPVNWLAFNSSGLLLAVIISTATEGASVQIINFPELLKCGSSHLDKVSHPMKICTTQPHGSQLRDFAWSPINPSLFVIVLQCGSAMLYHVSSEVQFQYKLVGQLPDSALVHCVSWSPKGKQLAICLNGTLATTNGPVCGPLILQVDSQMKQKRIILLNQICGSINANTDFSPIDILWTSSYCFLVATGQMNSNKTHLLYITTTPKSTQIKTMEIAELRGHSKLGRNVQYYLRLLGTDCVAATWADAGEEVIFLELPSTNNSLESPQIVLNVELPPNGLALSMDVGYWRMQPTSPPEKNTIVYLLTYLSTGHLSVFLIQSPNPNTLLSVNGTNVLELPEPPARLQSTPVSFAVSNQSIPVSPSTPIVAQCQQQGATDRTVDAIHNNAVRLDLQNSIFGEKQILSNGFSTNIGTTNNALTKSDSIITKSGPDIRNIDFSQGSSVRSTLQNSHILPIQQQISSASAPVNDTIRSTSTLTTFSSTTTSTASTTIATTTTTFTSNVDDKIDKRDQLVPRSVQLAASQFTLALQNEYELSHSVWSRLYATLSKGFVADTEQSMPKGTPNGEPIGVDVTEARLGDVDRFLQAMEKVITELDGTCKQHQIDIQSSIGYTDKLSRTLRSYASSDWLAIMSNQLDPKTARIFSQLKHRLRVVEAGMLDLENQIENVSEDLSSCSKVNVSKQSAVRIKPKTLNQEKVSEENNETKLLQAIDTNMNIIHSEQSRLNNIVSYMKKLGICQDTMVSGSINHQYRHQGSRRQSLMKRLPFQSDLLSNPMQVVIMQRDRALLRLFSNHKLPIIYSKQAIPPIRVSKAPRDHLVNADSSSNHKQNINTHQTGESLNSQSEPLKMVSPTSKTTTTGQKPETTSSPTNALNSRLEKLLVVSSNAATAKSPPVVKNLPTQSPNRLQKPISPAAAVSTVPQSFCVKEFEQPRTLLSSPKEALTTSSSNTILNSTNNDLLVNAVTNKPPCKPDQQVNTFVLGQKTASTVIVTSPPPSTGANVTQSREKDSSTRLNDNSLTLAPPTATLSPSPLTVIPPSTPLLKATPSTTNMMNLAPTSLSPSSSNIPIVDNNTTNNTFIQGSPQKSPSQPLLPLPTSAGMPPIQATGAFNSHTNAPTTTSSSAIGVNANITTGLGTGQPTPFLFGQPSNNVSQNTSAVTDFSASVTTAIGNNGLLSASDEKIGGSNVNATTAISSGQNLSNIVSTSNSLLGSPSATSLATITTATGGLFSSQNVIGQKSISSNMPTQDNRLSTTSSSLFSFAASINSPVTCQSSDASTPISGFSFLAAAAAGGGQATANNKKLFQHPTTTVSSPPSVAPSTGAAQTSIFSSNINLFGAMQTAQSGVKLFGSFQPNTTSAVSSPSTVNSGLFGSLPAPTTSNSTVGLFQFNSPNTNTTPSSHKNSTGFLFGSGATTTSGGLFGNVNKTTTSTYPFTSGGLFGSSTAATTNTQSFSNLFANSTFSLGDGNQEMKASPPTQNVFGRMATTGPQTPNVGLFGSMSTNQPAVSATSVVSNTQPSLFDSSILGSNISSHTSFPSGGGLFSSQQTSPTAFGGGTVSSAASPRTTGQAVFGLGGPVAFDAPVPGMGGGLFGSTSPIFGSNSGAGTAIATVNADGNNTGGLFAALANKSDNLSFGALAQGSNQVGVAPTSPFGSSPSFTQRRA